MNYIVCLITMLMTMFHQLTAGEIQIGLFNDHAVRSFLFTPLQDGYRMISPGKTLALQKNQLIYVSQIGDDIHIRRGNKLTVICDSIVFKSSTDSSGFRIKPVIPALKDRIYQGSVSVLSKNRHLQLVNTLAFEQYIAGVVETEGGPGATTEYYKAQALLCRTYAIKNYHRHSGEGFDLCDGVHCQAYKNKSYQNAAVINAVNQTRGLVLVDSGGKLIEAAFHSNSGGLTTNSGEIWIAQEPYLLSIPDPYSRSGTNFSWEKKIGRQAWEQYLVRNGLDPSDQPVPFSRKAYFFLGNDSVRYARIRHDWNLRSAFFSIQYGPDSIHISGKGYGHGVGLSQEGAMEMSRQGKKYPEIIHFYYQGVTIIPCSNLTDSLNHPCK